MTHSLATAAAACGVNKSTILRAIKNGKISAMKDQHGQWQIQPVELRRTYPLCSQARTEAPQDATSVLEAQLVGLKEVTDLLACAARDPAQCDMSGVSLGPPGSLGRRPDQVWPYVRCAFNCG
jgi:hypothetical protein